MKYTERETDLMHEKLEQRLNNIDARMERGFTGMYAKQDQTNSRLSKLEIWRARIAGAVAVITIVLLPLAFLVVRLVI